MPDWRSVREQYPALRGSCFLNTATFGQLSVRTVAAVNEHFRRRDAHAAADFLSWFDDADVLRASIGKLINADPADIAFAGTASTGLAWVVGGMEWRPGDRILALAGEFPNNTYFPALLGQRGAEFIETDWESLPNYLDERVRAVFISTVNYTSGFCPDLTGLSARLRELGAILYVDGTQSIGALRFDVQAVQPAMLSVDAYKWLCSPNGAGFVYVSKGLREIMQPTVVGWRSDRQWREVDNLNHGAPEFTDAAECYEGGMLNFPSLYGMQAAVDTVLELGPAEVEDRVLHLADQCARTLESFGGRIAHRGSPILSARFDGADASQLARDLKADGVLVSARHGGLRVSTHFYNDESDLAHLRDVLARSMGAQR